MNKKNRSTSRRFDVPPEKHARRVSGALEGHEQFEPKGVTFNP